MRPRNLLITTSAANSDRRLDDHVCSSADHTYSFAGTVKVGRDTSGVAVDPQRHLAFVANAGPDTVSVIDEATRRRTATLDAGKFITGIAVDEQFDTLYATNLLDNSVTIFDGQTNAVIDTVAVTLLPAAIAVDSQTHKAYITNDARANTVAVVVAQ